MLLEVVFIFTFSYVIISVVLWSFKTGISPMFSSFKSSLYLSKACKNHPYKTIIDLGSGWGTLALITAIKNPHKNVIGYELSSFPFYFSKLLKLLFRQKNLYFVQKDFFSLCFNSGTIYLCYLHPKAMQKLESKIAKSTIKPLLISSTFALPSYKSDNCFYLHDLYSTPIYLYNFSTSSYDKTA